MTGRLRVGLLATTLLIAGLTWRIATSDDQPRLVIDESVAADFAVLADQVFDRFVAAAPALASCIGHPRLQAAPSLDDLASYDQAAGIISVRVPATAPSLEASLVHELAHHLEQACASQRELRSDFLAAQGHPPDTEWFTGAAWPDRPSEQFAETVVEIVLGRRSRNQLRLRLTPDSLRVVERWLTSNT